MPTTRRPAKKTARPAASKPQPAPSKAPPASQAPKAAAAPRRGAISVEALKATIAYFYLLSFCPPARIAEWSRDWAPRRKVLAESAGLGEEAYLKIIAPEVCRRIVSFHQVSREPSRDLIDALATVAGQATSSPGAAERFQQEMAKVARLQPRAGMEGRLHRKKGCQFCQAPCFYGYFTLISDPQFKLLQELFAAEARKPRGQQNPWNPCLAFTRRHLRDLAGPAAEVIETRHLVNLAYCLLMLSMAKSRMPLPERQLQLMQAAGKAFLDRGPVRDPAKVN